MRWLDGITDSLDMGLGGLQAFTHRVAFEEVPPLEMRPSSIAPTTAES